MYKTFLSESAGRANEDIGNICLCIASSLSLQFITSLRGKHFVISIQSFYFFRHLLLVEIEIEIFAGSLLGFFKLLNSNLELKILIFDWSTNFWIPGPLFCIHQFEFGIFWNFYVILENKFDPWRTYWVSLNHTLTLVENIFKAVLTLTKKRHFSSISI